MTSRRLSVLAAAALVALLLAACGDNNGGEDSAETVAKPSPAVLARANANCRYFLRETKRIGREALHNEPPSTTLDLTTERLVKPSISLLERVANQQQALEPAAHTPLFNLYANLFDPIVVLARKRLSTGQAEDYARSKELEEMLTGLGLEQRRMARLAGLSDCDLDYQRILLKSLNE